MARTPIFGIVGAVVLTATLYGQPAEAQLTKAGVVVGLEGDARVQRLGAPAPSTLQFRDDIFVRDRATTGDNSMARFLLGGKAVLTMRERSVVTITETPSSSTVDITSGYFALAVAKERLKPGESIEIRTPNAVAGIRGTVVIAEVFQATAQAGGAPPASFSSRFTVIRGVVDVTPIDPATGQPRGPTVTLNPNDALTVTGSGVGAPQSLPPTQVQQLGATFTPTFQTTTTTLASLSDDETKRMSHLHGPRGKSERLGDVDPGDRDRDGNKDRNRDPDTIRPNSFGNPDKHKNPLNAIGGVPGNNSPDGKKGGGGGAGGGGGGGGGSAAGGTAGGAVTNAITGNNAGGGQGHGHGHGH
jgi:uncharacterized membrane protein YgcG